MKKFSIFMMLLIIATCIFNSCALRITTSTSRTLMPLEEPLMADIDVKTEKVTGTYTEKKRADEERIKKNAVFNALANGTKGDILVAPQYEIVKDARFNGARIKSVTVTVTGYPAFYKNFRPVPKVGEYEIREVTPQTPFVIVTKDAEGKPVTYEVKDPVYPEPGINMGSVESIRINPNNDANDGNKGKKK